ncbi:Tudor/PWWP/MBT domain-containing protein [Actinidia rufa]|uniref:Tudor/PWWP/MBT domain-containing protein n=1 Tax=Actinidia rufa TaxID=165716 RepID=A0A7J0GY21_9ERIC|nr:Tudor/PWWP/MBT domain-containing protein [Actinidia rufa]
MAPARKRGARGAKTKSELSLGDLVLAKVKGFPAWPAKISRPEDWKRAPDPKKYFVQFFGTAEIAFVAPADIQAFTSESKNKLSARCQGKTVKYFAQAVKEICEAFDLLQQKKSRGLGDDNDGSGPRCGASSVDGLEDDAVDFDLKDGIGRGTNGETVIRGLGDHCSGLERCSQRYGGIDCQDTKPGLSCKANDSCSPGISSKKKTKISKDSARISNEVVLAPSPYNSSCPTEEVCDAYQEDNVFCTDDSKVVTPADGCLNASQNDRVCDADAEGDDKKNDSSSVRAKHSDGGKKLLTNGHKSEKMTTGSKKKPKDEHTKADIRRKNPAYGSMKESSPDLKSDLDAVGENKAKKLAKDGQYFGVADDKKKAAKGSTEEQAKGKLSGWKKGAQLEPAKHHHSGINEVSHLARKSKHADLSNDGPKGSLSTKRKIDSQSSNVLVEKADNLKRSTSRLKTENRSASRVQAGSFSSNIPSDEDALPPTKRLRRAFEAISDSAIMTSDNKSDKVSVAIKNDMPSSEKVKSPVTQLHTKRRAVRLFDEEDEEEARTPVHGGSSSKIHASSGLKLALRRNAFPSAKIRNESLSPNPEQPVEKRSKKAISVHVSHSPGKPELERVSSKESKQILISPQKSPWSGVPNKAVSEPPNANRQSIKVLAAGSEKKTHTGSGKTSSMVSDGLNYSQNQVTTQRRNTMENNSFPSERMEAGSDDKMSSLIDLKISDAATSMKHLIAAAQAKRRQAHSQNISHDMVGSFLGSSTDVIGRSLSPASAVQPFLSGSSNILQPDVQGYYLHTSIASPSHCHQFSSNNQPNTEEFEERRVSSGHGPAGGSLSGGTEAAVARDAFEGMIETLSRTKESIGRATRLAIDCAKYGIANEVAELPRRGADTPEEALRVSNGDGRDGDGGGRGKAGGTGIAGASYIPTVQAALPRLLGAAAPSGAAARENRRQCLKVLRLWLERKILPDSLLRRYMDDIGVTNDDASAVFSLRRPSRAERAVDDPIREMEGMLVDEYGSNATFQLPGFLSSHVFEEDDEEDLPSSSYKEAGGGSPVESAPATGEPEPCMVTPNDRRHCILEDVDGELEMEDVSGHPKDERPLFANGSIDFVPQQKCSDGILEAAQNSSDEENKLVQVAANTPHGGHIDTTVRSEMYPHQSPCFAPAGGCDPREPAGYNSMRPLDYGLHDSYVNSQASQPNQQFQPGHFGQRPIHPAPPPQTPGSHYSFPNSTVQQHPQHPYPQPYTFLNLPDGSRRYIVDEQWRIPTGEFNTDNQRGAWMSGGRISCSGLPFAQEGYFRPPLERLPANNVGFQPSVPNTLPAGAPVPGHSVSQMMPSRPDMSALNCWRTS